MPWHQTWLSPATAIVYWYVYKWHDKPSWSLGVYEHCMSAWQITSFGVLLVATMRQTSGQKRADGYLLEVTADSMTTPADTMPATGLHVLA